MLLEVRIVHGSMPPAQPGVRSWSVGWHHQLWCVGTQQESGTALHALRCHELSLGGVRTDRVSPPPLVAGNNVLNALSWVCLHSHVGEKRKSLAWVLFRSTP